ncbi:hypothetical protein [Halorubellus salinus]|uniref:hypothetical protein n=1 Tax=Halorubellus salinus TaxID=755309 RepID=UPI001D08246C|nr:hypothetical protein [Halorubellus salinus]
MPCPTRSSNRRKATEPSATDARIDENPSGPRFRSEVLKGGFTRIDASSPDTSSLDASSFDASSPDTSSLDASSFDASSFDASSPDTSSLDASSFDASSPDTGGLDASSAGNHLGVRGRSNFFRYDRQ